MVLVKILTKKLKLYKKPKFVGYFPHRTHIPNRTLIQCCRVHSLSYRYDKYQNKLVHFIQEPNPRMNPFESKFACQYIGLEQVSKGKPVHVNEQPEIITFLTDGFNLNHCCDLGGSGSIQSTKRNSLYKITLEREVAIKMVIFQGKVSWCCPRGDGVLVYVTTTSNGFKYIDDTVN